MMFAGPLSWPSHIDLVRSLPLKIFHQRLVSTRPLATLTRQHGYPEDYPEREPVHASTRYVSTEKIDFGPSSKARPSALDSPEAIFDIGPTFKVREIGQRRDRLFRQAQASDLGHEPDTREGRYVKSTARRLSDDVALDATIRAAAPHQLRREAENGLFVTIRDEDIREKLRETRTGNFLLFIVDASGSMGARGRMVASKGAIMSLLKDAYQKRDRVAMVSFRKQEAVVNLPPTSSIYRAGELLKELPVGGKTPLGRGASQGARSAAERPAQRSRRVGRS